jgi:hypothetical protein
MSVEGVLDDAIDVVLAESEPWASLDIQAGLFCADSTETSRLHPPCPGFEAVSGAKKRGSSAITAAGVATELAPIVDRTVRAEDCA